MRPNYAKKILITITGISAIVAVLVRFVLHEARVSDRNNETDRDKFFHGIPPEADLPAWTMKEDEDTSSVLARKNSAERSAFQHDKNCLRLRILMISNKHGGLLRINDPGLVVLDLISSYPTNVPFALFKGKGAMEEAVPMPSYLAKDIDFYSGFAWSKWRIFILNKEGEVMESQQAPCQVSGLEFGRDKSYRICLPLTAPTAKGTYQIQVLLDSKPALDALRTFNTTFQHCEDEIVQSDVVPFTVD